jgi:hypothetical protein
MQSFDYKTNLEKTVASISALELKQLLIQLLKNPHICFRFRLIGEMWMQHLMSVNAINEKSVLLYDEVDNKHFLVRYNNIMQFEIDHRFQTYQPHFHYTVQPANELE